ncbi:hypothetical protein DsansV1_C01g0004141 [Dioscorea sansibarensis]
MAMNRIHRESLFGRGFARAGDSMDGDENLDLFSRRRRTHLISSSAESNGHGEMGKLDGLSVGSGKLRSGLDDLMASELGKHDYDWLLTPPGTPLFSSLDASEPKITTTAAPRNKPNVRSVSTTKASRLSVSQTDNGHSTRPARSVSAMRPSISATHSSSYLSSNNRTSVLNTSSASVTSRPSTPGSRSTTVSSTRTSVPTTRPGPSRSSTPTRTRPSTPTRTRPAPSSTGDKPKPAHNSRPSTPTSRPQIHTNSNSNSSAPSSRSSTPTRRAPAATVTTSTTRSPSAGRAVNRPASPSIGRPSVTNKPPSRPSSPAPRARAPVHPITLPDFPLDAPPNLRTKLPERPASAGRTRPGMALTVRAATNTEPTPPMSSNRRSSLPIVTKGRFPENSPKGRLHSNGNEVTPADVQKAMASEAASRRTAKPVSTTESNGFGRTISKSSLDMALRHMDIRQHIGGIRGTSLFPHSIRSNPKSRTVQTSDMKVPVVDIRANRNSNGHGMGSEDHNGAMLENGDNMLRSPDGESFMTRANEPDPYGSYRYDAILLKEDSKNMNWLHSVEDKSDQSPEFDHRFEPLPEPFSPL